MDSGDGEDVWAREAVNLPIHSDIMGRGLEHDMATPPTEEEEDDIDQQFVGGIGQEEVERMVESERDSIQRLMKDLDRLRAGSAVDVDNNPANRGRGGCDDIDLAAQGYFNEEEEAKITSARRNLREAREDRIESSSPYSEGGLVRRGKVEETLSQWQKWKENKLRAKIRAKREEESRQNSGKPQLCSHSIKMMKAKNLPPVEQRLLASGHYTKMRKSAQFAQVMRATVPGKPKISEFASNIVRAGDIGNRLYVKGKEMERKLEEARQEYLNKEAVENSQARALRSYHIARSAGPIGDDLYHRGIQRDRKKEIMRKLHDLEGPAYAPKTNRRSGIIASRLKQTARERLESGVKSLQVQKKIIKKAVEEEEKKKRRSEEAEKAKKKKKAQKKASPELFEKLYAEGKRMKEDLEKMQQKKAIDEMGECTFAPTINKQDDNARNSSFLASSSSSSSPGGVYTRNQSRSCVTTGSGQHRVDNTIARLYRWKQSVESKKKLRRDVKKARRLNQCTFQPVTTQNAAAAAFNSTGKERKHRNTATLNNRTRSTEKHDGGKYSRSVGRAAAEKSLRAVERLHDEFDDTYFESKLNTSDGIRLGDMERSPISMGKLKQPSVEDYERSMNIFVSEEYCEEPRNVLKYPLSKYKRVWYPSTDKDRLVLAALVKKNRDLTSRLQVRASNAEEKHLDRQKQARRRDYLIRRQLISEAKIKKSSAFVKKNNGDITSRLQLRVSNAEGDNLDQQNQGRRDSHLLRRQSTSETKRKKQMIAPTIPKPFKFSKSNAGRFTSSTVLQNHISFPNDVIETYYEGNERQISDVGEDGMFIPLGEEIRDAGDHDKSTRE
mmetsp:Transcript_10665/g.17177  ORF Transcript_10665/g.17177 Transcript_10665/m.17177 type:complete len:838 (-) Transcript_10665:223-2736(-)